MLSNEDISKIFSKSLNLIELLVLANENDISNIECNDLINFIKLEHTTNLS